MLRFVFFADKISAWIGKAFAWLILLMTLAVSYEIVVRKAFRAPNAWAFDFTYMMYGALFMVGGAYTLSRDGHVRADFIYRLWRPRVQAAVDLVLYIVFFFPGVTALMFAGWRYAARSWRYLEVSSNSPAGIPIFQLKTIIVFAGALLFIQGIAQVFRCIICLRTGEWVRARDDVEETETLLLDPRTRDIIQHSGEAVDVPSGITRPDDRPGRKD